MAIDPLLYEKMSGRSGDPYSRMGEALAGSDAAQSKLKAQKDVPVSVKMAHGYFQYKLIMATAGLALAALAALIAWFLR